MFGYIERYGSCGLDNIPSALAKFCDNSKQAFVSTVKIAQACEQLPLHVAVF
jgi:hypothetical protein